jgi:hypothetical protein
MPEFEGTSETLSFQQALEDAVRKAYTAYQRRTHTDPLFSYVVKRISGHLRTLTVVIETVLDESESKSQEPPRQQEPKDQRESKDERESRDQRAPKDSRPIDVQDPIKALLEKQRRNEELTPNEQALIDLLRQEPKKDR